MKTRIILCGACGKMGANVLSLLSTDEQATAVCGVDLQILGIGQNGFTAEAFIAGAFINSIPGIILQFITIPGIMLALEKTHLMPYQKKKTETNDEQSSVENKE